MNKLTQIFLVLFMICLPVTLWADNDKADTLQAPCPKLTDG